MEKVFLAMYNPQIHESAFGVISVHKTRRGAEMAIEFDKKEKKKEWEEIYPEEDRWEFPFGIFELWTIREFNINL